MAVEHLPLFDPNDAANNLQIIHKAIQNITDPERRALYLLSLLQHQAILLGQMDTVPPLPGESGPWGFAE